MSRPGVFAPVLVALGLAVASDARADYNTSTVSLLYGFRFDDLGTGNVTSDGRLFTVTIDNSLGWKYGDQYFFADLYAGRFTGIPNDFRAYAEWQPRLSLSSILGTELALGPFKDLLVAGELNYGAGFGAVLGGLGTNIKMPAGGFWALNLYARKDNFNRPTYQVTTAWSVPFHVGGLGLAFDGFMDVYGTDQTPFNVLTQPQLLVDVGALAGLEKRQLQLGVEWWLHRFDDHFTSAPQAMAKWAY